MSGSNGRVTIFDTTLRDGEQSPGATMNLAEKLEVARALRERPSIAPKPGGAVFRTAPGACLRQAQQARFRFMGAQPARAPDAMGQSVGTRLPRMAYRVLGDVDEIPG